MPRSPRKALARFAIIWLALSLVLQVCGCSDDDCPTCPECKEPETHNDLYDGRLYVAAWNCDDDLCNHSYSCIYVIDTKAETVVDSIVYSPGVDINCLEVSEDGRYIAVNASSTHLYDAATLEEIATPSSMDGLIHGFTQNNQYLLIEADSRLRVFSVPDCQLVHEDSVGVGHYLAALNSTMCTADEGRELYEYSLDSFEVVTRWQFSSKEGTQYKLFHFDFSSDGEAIYASVIAEAEDSDWRLMILDLAADSPAELSENQIGLVESIQVGPSRTEVYALEWPRSDQSAPGQVYVFSAIDGDWIAGISLWNAVPDPMLSVWGRNMVLSPDGTQLYVATHAPTYGEAPDLLRMDTRSRRVENRLFAPESAESHLFIVSHCLAIAPKP